MNQAQSAADQARQLLGRREGSRTAQALGWAVLAVAEALDRIATALNPQE